MATILVIDDRAICREFLVTLLGYGHHHLIEACDGAEALKIIKEVHVELIITDLLMPTMNGYELVQKIKADPKLANIPIIFYTASFLEDEARLLADTCGVKHVLYKPSDPQLILDTVNEALGMTEIAGVLAAEPPDSVPAPKKIPTREDRLSYYLSKIDDTKKEFSSAIEEINRMHIGGERLLKISDHITHIIEHLSKISFQLAVMSELSLNMISEREPNRLLMLCCEGARRIIGSKYCFLGILDNDNSDLKYFIISGMENLPERKLAIPLLECDLIRQLLNSDDVIQINDNKKLLLEFPPGHPKINSFLGATLITPNYLHGFIYFADKEDKTEFNEDDDQVILTLATEISLLYENIELYETIQRHAAKLQITVNEQGLYQHDLNHN